MASRYKTAVTPLRRSLSADRNHPAPSVNQLVAELRPAEPLHCQRPGVVTATARRFTAAFAEAVAGDVMYAVKCNPDPTLLRALAAGGVRHFDCASPAEIRLVRQMFPDAAIHYMHPVKNRAAIREAYGEHGVRDFALDSRDELDKILTEVTPLAAEDTDPGRADLGLIIRLAMPKGQAAYDLSAKFGAAVDEAAALLRAARPLAARLGVSFHVGSQCLNPDAYRRALAIAGQVIHAAGVAIDIVDVGGGFPARYPGTCPPPLADYMRAIRNGVADLRLAPGARVWCEPGRALVAEGVSIVVQVERRRGDELFINDGVYGSLSDAGALGMRFPVRAIPAEPDARRRGDTLAAFRFWGPTCDSADHMKGPFLLPEGIAEGDWIEIGQLGAYGAALRTGFNGFDRARLAEVRDAPLTVAASRVSMRADGRYGILRRVIA